MNRIIEEMVKRNSYAMAGELNTINKPEKSDIPQNENNNELLLKIE